GPGDHQRPRPSAVSGSRHFRGGDAPLPSRRLSGTPLDLSRLPPGRLPPVLRSMPRAAASNVVVSKVVDLVIDKCIYISGRWQRGGARFWPEIQRRGCVAVVRTALLVI